MDECTAKANTNMLRVTSTKGNGAFFILIVFMFFLSLNLFCYQRSFNQFHSFECAHVQKNANRTDDKRHGQGVVKYVADDGTVCEKFEGEWQAGKVLFLIMQP